MERKIKMTGRIVAAARALTGVSREDFAKAAGMKAETIGIIEAHGSAWIDSADEAEAVVRAFERFGVVALDESDGMGAGVRLKFTRQDVKQIVRLEGEGGIARPDDVP